MLRLRFLSKKGKEIHATEVGRRLILSLPEVMVRPDMTAHWESQLEAIADKRMNYSQIMTPMLDGLYLLVNQVSSIKLAGLQGHGKAATPRKKRKRKAP